MSHLPVDHIPGRRELAAPCRCHSNQLSRRTPIRSSLGVFANLWDAYHSHSVSHTISDRCHHSLAYISVDDVYSITSLD
ncbi:hypothetical protein KSP39_PZI021933 [Platanthera zijinensis]|uniref:Uncharacterized protein n=1 Tax=Platanthera zijinensis TaxID=2320716 RepID=A0AAP0FVU1_9ASPA